MNTFDYEFESDDEPVREDPAGEELEGGDEDESAKAQSRD
jgi:hypothetical protein